MKNHLQLLASALTNPSEYKIIVGSLQYVCLTRLDIAYVVNKLSQFMHRPTNAHWNAVKHLLRYPFGTIYHGLTLQSSYISLLMPFQILIGLVLRMTTPPLVLMLFIYAIEYLGTPRKFLMFVLLLLKVLNKFS